MVKERSGCRKKLISSATTVKPRSARRPSLPKKIAGEVRLGRHLGHGDLMGDGVNIAARLEGIAQPAAICLSEDAYRQVRARLDLEVNDLGATQLKNIVEPVRVYSLQVGLPAQAKPATRLLPAPSRFLVELPINGPNSDVA
jgi:adenylate cyclase